jgi:hypothetical protein
MKKLSRILIFQQFNQKEKLHLKSLFQNPNNKHLEYIKKEKKKNINLNKYL